MLRGLFALTMIAVSFSFCDFVHGNEYLPNEKSHCACPPSANFVTTNFTLTPSANNSTYVLTAVPVAKNGFFIDGNGSITLPVEGDYVISYNLRFSFSQPTQDIQINGVFANFSAFILTDSSTGTQVGTLRNLNGTAVVHAKGPVTVSIIYINSFLPNLPQLFGLINVAKLHSTKKNIKLNF